MLFLIGSKDTTLAADIIADVTYKIGAPKEMKFLHFYLEIDRNTPIWSYNFYTRDDEDDKPFLIDSGRIDSQEGIKEVLDKFHEFSWTTYQNMFYGLKHSDYSTKNLYWP